MQKEQFRRVIDSFDTNGDGTVSRKEFLSFVMPDNGEARPVVRGDTSAVLERKSIYETTCWLTGMPNAFVVTAGMSKAKDEDNVTIIKRKDGSHRRIVELPERLKRWNILKKFGLVKGDLAEVSEDTKPPKVCEVALWDSLALFDDGKKKGGDDYEDDYEDDYDDDEVDGGKVPVRVKKARSALELLYDMSSENRAALTLKSMMEKGTPPPAPDLWSAEVGHGEVGDGLDALTDRLLIQWRAQPNSLVAFFALEMSGALGTKEQQNNEFKEIFRDPPDANSEAEFSFWIDRLQQNTTYR